MLRILNFNKQTNSWRLKEHFNSFTKLVTFQSGIIKVYFNWCVYQFLVSFFEKQHPYSPMICLADWPIVVHFVVLYFLCHIWTYYCWLSPGTVGCLSVLSFCSLILSLHLCHPMTAFLFSLTFFNYLNFSFISFIGCTSFLRLFVCFPFYLLCCSPFCFLTSFIIAMSFLFFFDF